MKKAENNNPSLLFGRGKKEAKQTYRDRIHTDMLVMLILTDKEITTGNNEKNKYKKENIFNMHKKRHVGKDRKTDRQKIEKQKEHKL